MVCLAEGNCWEPFFTVQPRSQYTIEAITERGREMLRIHYGSVNIEITRQWDPPYSGPNHSGRLEDYLYFVVSVKIDEIPHGRWLCDAFMLTYEERKGEKFIALALQRAPGRVAPHSTPIETGEIEVHLFSTRGLYKAHEIVACEVCRADNTSQSRLHGCRQCMFNYLNSCVLNHP